MGERTPLYEAHLAAGAKMVDFGGWDMPIHYGSQLDEHHVVRGDAGMFDVSHMRVVDLHGAQAADFLRFLLANNIDKLRDSGKAIYSCMLNDEAGIKDDLIVYFMDPSWFRVVVNAGTADGDIDWMRLQSAGFSDLQINPREDLAMIAVQGPNARQKAAAAVLEKFGLSVPSLGVFSAADLGSVFVGRTGYTGEDGFEIAVDAADAVGLWDALAAAEVAPCGLGARDTLRLEAGMNLYGNDMDESTTPLESGLGWTVGWEPPDRSFVGRSALEAQRKSGVERKLVGLVLEERGVLRGHQTVLCGEHGHGETTSGTFSPTLSKAIALARVPAAVAVGDRVEVEVRNKKLAARVVRYPFVRNGQAVYDN